MKDRNELEERDKARGNDRDMRGFGLKVAIFVILIFVVPIVLKAVGLLPQRIL